MIKKYKVQTTHSNTKWKHLQCTSSLQSWNIPQNSCGGVAKMSGLDSSCSPPAGLETGTSELYQLLCQRPLIIWEGRIRREWENLWNFEILLWKEKNHYFPFPTLDKKQFVMGKQGGIVKLADVVSCWGGDMYTICRSQWDGSGE